MRKASMLAAGALALGVVALGPKGVQATDIHSETETTTTKTTTYSGTVTEISPSTSTLIIKSESQPEPLRYTINEKTTFVDSEGNVVTTEQIRNVPVTVHVMQEGGQTIATRVVATRPVMKKTTTETEIETR